MKDRTYIAKEDGTEFVAKDITLFDSPEPLRALMNPLGWRILQSFAKRPKYPAQVARELGLYRQKVYYYIHRFVKAGLISACREAEVKGGLAKYYELSSPAVGVEIQEGWRRVEGSVRMERVLEEFWSPIVTSGVFDGIIIVGSPEPHGPNRAAARDGHYGVHLAFFLGRFCRMPRDFVVKLDVDVKAERIEGSSMVLIGGPGTNIITSSINHRLPIRFNEQNYWGGLTDERGRLYTSERDGIVAKIPNPSDPKKGIIILAGNRHAGTKAAVIAATSFWGDVLKGYRGEATWAAAVRGFDMDGDGKIDSVEVLS